MEDIVCPRCKTTKYRNPSLKLLVNVCGHALCESCVDLLFVKGSGSCPECGIPLRRAGFRVQLFEDPVVEKEVDIRKRVLRDYCKRESDFASLREYNDYLEEIETIVFNLVNNLDIIETNKRIDQYKKDNKEQIAKARSKMNMNEDLIELEEILHSERVRAEMAILEAANLEKQERMRKLKSHEALIDDLMFSETDAKDIVASHKNAKAKIEYEVKLETPIVPAAPTTFTSGIGFGAGRSMFLPVPKVEEVPLYEYEELVLDYGGLVPPTVEELKTTKSSYLNYIKAATPADLAGGFHPSISCRRALQDAFADVSLQPKLLRKTETVADANVDAEEEPMDIS